MAKKHESNKYLVLENVRVSYNPKEDSVHLTSGDPDLQSTRFHLKLNQGTSTEAALRSLLVDHGLISPRFATGKPDWKSKGKILSMLGRGGVGKTVFTYSLATVLAKAGMKIAVIDGDFLDPQMQYLVEEKTTQNIFSYLRDAPVGKAVQDYMVATKQGWDVLFAPERGKEAGFITEAVLKSMLDELKANYDLVLVDSSVNFSSPLNHLFWSESDYLLWLMHGTPNECERYTRLLDELRAKPNLESIAERVGIVINFTLTETNLDSWQDVPNAHIVATVPYYREVPLATQNPDGLSSLLDDRNTYTRAITQLSQLMKALV